MIKAVILSFSDGRKRVHDSLADYISDSALKVKAALESTGEAEITIYDDIVYDNGKAVQAGKFAGAQYPDAVILNVPVFAFPNFACIAYQFLNVPCLAISPENGSMPGMGGVKAAVNMIKQTGGSCEGIWGNICDDKILRRIMSFLRAAKASVRLKGQVYGLIGGRSIGMGSAFSSADVWMNKFGIDIDHTDQMDLARRVEDIDENKADAAYKWLTSSVGSVEFDGDKLREDTLKRQVRYYIALKELISEKHLSFVGLKCHYELSEYDVTQCVSAALLNDPYDWEGEKEPFVLSCEADSDGALTMQVLKLITNLPVLFFDFRHFDAEENVFTFCNCGSMATWYAQRSSDPKENLKSVTLCPVIQKYAGGGCHVNYMAKQGEMTLCRLTHELNKYKFTVFKGECIKYPEEKLKETSTSWPTGFVKAACDARKLIDAYDNNHVHAVYGDYVDEIRNFCKFKDIEFEYIE